MSQPIRGQGGHLCFPIEPKSTNLVEEFKYLQMLPVKFRQIPFIGFGEENDAHTESQVVFIAAAQPEKRHWVSDDDSDGRTTDNALVNFPMHV